MSVIELPDDPAMDEPETCVFIRENLEPGINPFWDIKDCRTQEVLQSCWTKVGAIDYCNSVSWDVRDDPFDMSGDADDTSVEDDFWRG